MVKDMNTYMKNRWSRRRAEAIRRLGGKCFKCGETQSLQFDHIDHKTKYKTIAKLSSARDEIFWEEVSKCQLLCGDCHREKTLIDLNQKDARRIHGTLSSYRYCKCDDCKKAKSDYHKEYKKRKSSS